LPYRIEYRPAAERSIAKMDRFITQQVVSDIEKLAENPRPHGLKPLKGSKERFYRVALGPKKNYRAIYQILDERLLIVVVDVGDRKEVYRRLK
jgi:mRNA interferase RelE/StbE